MSFLERINALCRYAFVGGDILFEEALQERDYNLKMAEEQNVILLSRDSIEYLDSEDLRRVLREQIRNGAHAYPTPPVDIELADIMVLLLCSVQYTMHPASFNWPNSTSMIYLSLWRALGAYSRNSTNGETITHLLKGRSANGYLHSIGINPQSIDNSKRKLPDVDSEIRGELSRCFDAGMSNPTLFNQQTIMFQPLYVDDLTSVLCRTIRVHSDLDKK